MASVVQGEVILITNADISLHEGWTIDNLNEFTLPVDTLLVPIRQELACTWNDQVRYDCEGLHQCMSIVIILFLSATYL